MALKGHVGFTIPDTKDIGRHIVTHFTRLGYHAIDERPNEWMFRRGKKSAVWWRFNIRAYFTTLTVRVAPQNNGEAWIACDWEVYTFMSFTTGGDVLTLEAEGRALESALRGAT